MFAPFGFCYSMQQGRFLGVIGDLPYKMAGWYHSALLAKNAPRVGFRHRATAAGVQGAEIDARAQQLRAGAWMLPEITDASCAAMGGPVLPLEITGAASGAHGAGRELCQGEKITGHGCHRPGREYRRQGAAAPGRCLDAAGDHLHRAASGRISGDCDSSAILAAAVKSSNTGSPVYPALTHKSFILSTIS